MYISGNCPGATRLWGGGWGSIAKGVNRNNNFLPNMSDVLFLMSDV